MTAREFRMPSLGADMDEGRIVEWKVKPGDHVERGDIVAVVDTEKAEIDVEVFETGTIDAIVVAAGEVVPVGTVLATLRADGEQPSAPTTPTPPPAPPAPVAPPLPPAPAPSAPAPVARPDTGELASPIVRRLARHLAVDLSTVQGSGPGGRVTRADVEAAAGAPVAAPAVVPEPVESTRQASMRQAIGALMSRSKREIPHYYVAAQIDMGAAIDWLGDLNAARPVTQRVLPAAVLLKATALAVREVPHLNGFWTDGAFTPSESVHLGVAIALREGGLIAPAIHAADALTLDELMASLRDLVGRVRSGRLRASEMSDATITVTNLGDAGAETVFGVIYPPQVGLVGFGAIVERPWARDGMLGVHPVVSATLAADHRATDGREGAHFLQVLDRLLQHPEQL
jgi:pyruvate dehydrogenase E2 component (dihydrolipoamide acetyltransferase)